MKYLASDISEKKIPLYLWRQSVHTTDFATFYPLNKKKERVTKQRVRLKLCNMNWLMMS